MTQDEIIEMSKQAGCEFENEWGNYEFCIEDLEAFAKLVAAKEREACALVCDEVDKESQSQWPKRLATMIRARGKT